jgi:hypothetical protein
LALLVGIWLRCLFSVSGALLGAPCAVALVAPLLLPDCFVAVALLGYFVGLICTVSVCWLVSVIVRVS